MSQTRPSLVEDGLLHFDRLSKIGQKPPLFEPGEPLFWDDPHISQQMLAAHLDPTTEAASRPPDVIAQTVAWVIEVLGLQPGDALLDLGCGPGLYCQQFARRGLRATGVDLSPNSITYARQHDPGSTYLCQNYLTLDPIGPFRAITLIYGDLCVLSDEHRDRLLRTVRDSLPPGGCFVVDVTTRLHHDQHRLEPGWWVSEGGGFWKPGPYLELRSVFDYREHDTLLEQYTIIETNGAISVYRNWFYYYSAETITAVLEAHGFAVLGLYNDLTGTPHTPDSAWIGVVAQKV